MVISTEFGVPARTDDGRLAVSSATVKVSSSVSASCTARINCDPVVEPRRTMMDPGALTSPASDVSCRTTTGISINSGSASDSVAVTVTDEPSDTGFGAAESHTAGEPSSSWIVICTELAVPAVTDDGRLTVSSATVNVSLSSSASWFVEIVPVPLVSPELIVMLVSVPWSLDSAVSSVTVNGIVTVLDSVAESVALTVTEEPSSTGFGKADSVTVGGACRVTVTV